MALLSTGLVLASAVSAGAAGALSVRPARRVHGRGPRLRRPSSRMLLVGVGPGVVAAVAAGLHGRHVGLVVVVSVAVLGGLRGVERTRQERLARSRRLRVVDYCEALVGELRAGQPVTRSLVRSAETWSEAGALAAAAGLGASVPDAMRRLSTLPGAEAVRRLAGAWEISAGTGAGLVLAVEQVLATVRAEEATARLVRSELASARATARLVTALPVVVLLAAQGIGARPWHFLLDTVPGIACLGAGVVLSLVGLAWIDGIAARSVEAG